MRIRAVAALMLASMMIAVSAFAQATPPRAAAQQSASIDDWTGLYVGADVGHVSNSIAAPIVLAGFTSPVTLATSTVTFGPATAGSGVVGIHAGYNIKLLNALVAGLEVQLAHASGTATQTAGTQATGSAFFIPTDSFTVDSGRLLSIRGRAGTAMTRDLFVYGTIGVGMTKVTATGVFPAVNGFPLANGTESHTMKGLAVGVGGEYAPFHSGTLRQLTIGAEFRHTSLGTQTFDFGDVDVFQPPPIVEPAVGTVTMSANEFDVRVNFRFPMKKK